MSLLLYERSTKTRVELLEENGETIARLSVCNGPVENDCPVVDRNQSLLHQSDVYVLDSTKSGSHLRTKESGFYGRILQPLFNDLFLVKHKYVATTSSTSIKEFSSALRSNGRPILMVIIAGDTSISEFINSLPQVETGEICVFVVPAGTGNSFALLLGILDEKVAAQRLFLHMDKSAKPLNVYQAEFPSGTYICDNTETNIYLSDPVLFVVVASWAFHASLVADSDTEAMRKQGAGRFKIAAHNNLSQRQEYRGKLFVSDKSGPKTIHEGPFAYLVVTPSQKFEPSFNILPRGDVSNSDLYVVGFNTQSDESYILDIMKMVYNDGCHIADERVFYERVDSLLKIQLVLGSNKNIDRRRFCVDGAIFVVPDAQDNSITISYHGSMVNGWNLCSLS